MKKLICCLLVISMLFAMSTSAFAGEVGTVNGDNANSEEGCIIDMTEVKEMPKYPNEGSIRKVRGVIVVKLQETAEKE